MSAEHKHVIVVAGVGQLGVNIARALLESKKYDVRLIYRVASLEKDAKKKATVDELLKLGAHSIDADITDAKNQALLTEKLKGVQTVVAALGGNDLVDAQVSLLKASVAAGVKRFVPSEFGMKLDKDLHLLIDLKLRVREEIKKSGIDYTYFITGFWYETSFSDFLSLNFKGGKISVVGEGYAKASYISLVDVGKFVAEALNDPRSRNAEVYIEAETTTFNDIIHDYEAKSGKKLDVTYRNLTEVSAAVKAAANPFAVIGDALLVLNATGKVLNPEKWNSRYPSVKPITIQEYLAAQK